VRRRMAQLVLRLARGETECLTGEAQRRFAYHRDRRGGRSFTHHFALDDIQEAFDLFSHQRDGVLKVALYPEKVRHHRRMLEAVGADALDEQC
jgi:hypothetical protein